ncbi:carbohydrate ABC transporter permease [Actinoplanes couchii]|uniref:ABC transporter permease n=1 Tax=Actinoplanes couchii TaxID=403638 RepID=A0ABQ3X8B1_9ACTN|nr:carbohydrate ABC transporter permease [Actinoplanes couchii]MDR6320247.1 multiple sugar transport system permease protein [Actinoplanes couchii]GID54740.1 ABC transporter permease [Actinoplanes couchii]
MARRRLPFSRRHLLLMPLALLFVLPILQLVSSSFMSTDEITRSPPKLVPGRLDLGGYQRLFTETGIVHWFANTVLVSTVAVVSHLVLCSLAGYGFARLSFTGRAPAFVLVLLTSMIPPQLLLIPTYVMFARAGLTDTLAAAFLPWTASAFGIFLMRQFFLSLPVELEESAALDGCGTLRTFVYIALPLARPALVTLAVLTLISSWNDLLWPLVAIDADTHRTLQSGLAGFRGIHHTQWPELMAGNVVATAPLLAIFLLAQRQFVATVTGTVAPHGS